MKGWVRLQVGSFSLENQWSVEPGSIAVFFGPSGSGKTLTLRAIAGLIHPKEGRIEVDSRVVYDHATAVWTPPHQRRVGYLPQDYLLFPHLNVAGNVAYGLDGMSKAGREERVAALVAQLRLEGMEHRRVWELSGGQKQRVALARALAPRPAALLLDEPFSALDMELRRSLRSELRKLLRESQIPIILVTHDREEALALGDTVQVMEGGRTIAQGNPVSVLGQPPTSLVARLVGVENLYQGLVTSLSPHNGTMVCRVNDTDVEVSLASVSVGDALTLGLRSRDVILATQRPSGLSARNIMEGIVTGLEARSPGVHVEVQCNGLVVRSQVTQEAAEELGIALGKTVWVIAKASSFFLVAP